MHLLDVGRELESLLNLHNAGFTGLDGFCHFQKRLAENPAVRTKACCWASLMSAELFLVLRNS
jgi:hypothetical protein